MHGRTCQKLLNLSDFKRTSFSDLAVEKYFENF
jgi:hypothetical protein